MQKLLLDTDVAVTGHGPRENPNRPCFNRRFCNETQQREPNSDSSDNLDRRAAL